MKEAKIFLLDLNPSSEVGCTLDETHQGEPQSAVWRRVAKDRHPPQPRPGLRRLKIR